MEPILAKSDERRYTLGVVYEPDIVDTQGDFAKAEDIEKAAWDYMLRLQVVVKSAEAVLSALSESNEAEIDVTELVEKGAGLDDQHLQVSHEVGTVVESYIAPTDMEINGQKVAKGSWLLGVVWTPEMFDKIKKGDRTGLSMYGKAVRQ